MSRAYHHTPRANLPVTCVYHPTSRAYHPTSRVALFYMHIALCHVPTALRHTYVTPYASPTLSSYTPLALPPYAAPTRCSVLMQRVFVPGSLPVTRREPYKGFSIRGALWCETLLHCDISNMFQCPISMPYFNAPFLCPRMLSLSAHTRFRLTSLSLAPLSSLPPLCLLPPSLPPPHPSLQGHTASLGPAACGEGTLSPYAYAVRYLVLTQRTELSPFALAMRCPVLA
eukprot:2398258-Rhodomonas_salina.2